MKINNGIIVAFLFKIGKYEKVESSGNSPTIEISNKILQSQVRKRPNFTPPRYPPLAKNKFVLGNKIIFSDLYKLK